MRKRHLLFKIRKNIGFLFKINFLYLGEAFLVLNWFKFRVCSQFTFHNGNPINTFESIIFQMLLWDSVCFDFNLNLSLFRELLIVFESFENNFLYPENFQIYLMSILSSENLYAGNKLTKSCSNDEFSGINVRSEPASEGFSSTLVLQFDLDPVPKPRSKLINITKQVPGSSKTKKILLPVFYKKSLKNSQKNLYLENSFSSTPLYDSVSEQVCSKHKGKKQEKATSTTFASMHTLSNLDGEMNNEIFNEKINFKYEQEVKASIHEGNFVAFCRKCSKETVCVMKSEIKSFVELVFCCCSNLNVKGNVFVCPTCGDVLLKTN